MGALQGNPHKLGDTHIEDGRQKEKEKEMTDNPQTTYALFKDGEQISTSHSTRYVCVIEAYERGLIVVGFKDFVSDPGPYRQLPALAKNVEIREVSND